MNGGFPSSSRVKTLDAGDFTAVIAQTNPLRAGDGQHVFASSRVFATARARLMT